MGLLYVIIPIGSGERVSFLSTILLTEIMFLVMITNFVPLSKQIPIIGWLFLSFTILLTILTVAVLALEKLHHSFINEDESKSHQFEEHTKKETDVVDEF